MDLYIFQDQSAASVTWDRANENGAKLLGYPWNDCQCSRNTSHAEHPESSSLMFKLKLITATSWCHVTCHREFLNLGILLTFL